jgi:hypothetical protein
MAPAEPPLPAMAPVLAPPAPAPALEPPWPPVPELPLAPALGDSTVAMAPAAPPMPAAAPALGVSIDIGEPASPIVSRSGAGFSDEQAPIEAAKMATIKQSVEKDLKCTMDLLRASCLRAMPRQVYNTQCRAPSQAARAIVSRCSAHELSCLR